MSENNISKNKSFGRVYTPDYIVNNILNLSGYILGNISKKHVIDNSCGDGAFLQEIVKRYCEDFLKHNHNKMVLKAELEEFIHGIEIDQEEVLKCKSNLDQITKEYGIEKVNWDILCADSLMVDKFNNKMDFVLGNPPYIRIHNLGNSYHLVKKFNFAKTGMTDLYLVFYELGISMLNESGILGYITPSSYFNSVAAKEMRKYLVTNNLIEKIVDLQHFQPFKATTYTTITILNKQKIHKNTEYYQYDKANLKPNYIHNLSIEDFYLNSFFYFAKKEDLTFLKKILLNKQESDIFVKNGYATLKDNFFVSDFNFSSKYIIPVIKASKGIFKQIFYPYDQEGNLISIDQLAKEPILYDYLLNHKEALLKRANEKNSEKYWYAFGRSQGILDTYKNKVAINTLAQNLKDLKIINCPSGTGVYAGLYIISASKGYEEIKKALYREEFIKYIALLGKYRNGGYYTFSSKDLKAYLDYFFRAKEIENE
ncbi:HsdM family class I SAM-dependent methyltransferase [Mycoplasmopsis gallopavonis]|uniref:site-specific DNA-methyltransferase (adenine-specific) n=1 Tax=Mycoplasmopsis gallopavonis TaxID=76629 RepID=A0A449AYM1_9BACT|nr:N-6 DNA methylase [Mycoplasmopsis gallopavonis]VEU72600.1 Type IIS restriction enzyme Eco57I [Mycoplasmopsis gallopavonis]